MDTKIRHLEMIQAVIARLAHNSFLLKGWAVTLTVALLALATEPAKFARAAALYAGPAVVFWGLDAYYLTLERRFRRLYQAVLEPGSAVPEFSLDIAEFGGVSFWSALGSPAVWPLYTALLAVAAVVAFFAGG